MISASAGANRRHGRNIYVATAGGGGSNANSGLTTALPKLTIAGAEAIVAAGDNIVIRGGTYTHSADLTLTVSGTAAAPITMMSYPGETAVIAGAATSALGHDWYVGNYGGTDGNYRSFLGLEITAWNHGFYCNGHHCLVNLCYMHDIWTNGLFFDGDVVNNGNHSSNNVVINCHTLNTSFLNSPAGAGANGQAITFNYADNSKAINNFVERSWGEAIGLISTTGCVIKGNTVTDAWDVYLYNDSSPNAVWDSNLCYATGLNSARGAGVGSDGIVFAQERIDRVGFEMDGIVVMNNIFINLANGIYFYIYDINTGHSPRNCTIANNTIVNASSSSLRWATDTGGSGNIFRNNILYHTSAGTNQTAADAATFTHDHNCWFNGVSGTWSGTGDVTTNPNLVAPATLTAAAQRPQVGSPVLDTGTTVAAVTVDYANAPRTATYSIGAYETS